MTRRNSHLTGMQGVYLVAAELSSRGFVVSPTSRSAKGADLLATDIECTKAFSIQVKTNGVRRNSFLLNEGSEKFTSDSHVFVFVTLSPTSENTQPIAPEYFVVPGTDLKRLIRNAVRATGSHWWWVKRGDLLKQNRKDRWDAFEPSLLSTS